MTATAETPRTTYQGAGVPRLTEQRTRPPRQRVDLDFANATFLPDPIPPFHELLSRFRAIRGADARDPGGWIPALQIGDAKAVANYTTYALRNDLPGLDRRDAAVIWEKWRLAVKWLRGRVHRYPDDQRLPDLFRFDVSLTNIIDELKTAVASPGGVALHYCPWAADFFTLDRLHPEHA